MDNHLFYQFSKASFLSKATEEFDLEKFNQKYGGLGPVSSLQWLGYILENVAEGKLFVECQKADLKINRIPLLQCGAI